MGGGAPQTLPWSGNSSLALIELNSHLSTIGPNATGKKERRGGEERKREKERERALWGLLMPPDGPPFPLPPPRRPTICAHPMHMLPLSLSTTVLGLYQPQSACVCVCVCNLVELETHNSSLGYPEEEKRQEERRTQYAVQRKIKKSTSISGELSVRLHSGRKEQPQKAQTASGWESWKETTQITHANKTCNFRFSFLWARRLCTVILYHKIGRWGLRSAGRWICWPSS